MENKILSNIFGIIGTVLWSIQLIPQIHLNYKRKSTKGVSPTCFGCWYACGIILGTNLVFNQEPPALVVQISCFSLFSLVIVFQHLFYQKKYNLKRLGFTIILCVLVSIASIISIYAILDATKNTNGIAAQIVLSIIATALMAIGFIPQVLEIYHEKVGLSKIFVIMDFFGGVFSILSLTFHEPFDYMSFATYVVVPIFQAIILLLIIRTTIKAHRTNLDNNLSSNSFIPFENINDDDNDNNNNNGRGKGNNDHSSIDINEHTSLNKDNNNYHNEEHDNNNNNKGGSSIFGGSGGAQDEESADHQHNQVDNIPLISSTSSFKDTHHLIRESISSSSFVGDINNDDHHHHHTDNHQHQLQQQMDGEAATPLSSSPPPNQPRIQELDHMVPLSISHTAELLIKQQQLQQLAQQQSMVDESINQLRNNIINNHNIYLINQK